MIAQIFIYCGYKAKTIIKNTYSKRTYILCMMMLAVTSYIYMKTYKLNGRVDMNSGCFNNIMFYAMNSVLGITIVILFSILIRKIPVIWRVLSYLGKNSLYIMLFHILAISFAQSEIVNYIPKIVRENMWNLIL